jgi:pimeloyl-ACP methyl ester carboxylesterase
MNTSSLETWGSPMTWRGFSARQGELNGFNLKIVSPPLEKAGRPWIWKTEFLDAFPNADEELVRLGFYLVHLDVPDHFGSPKAVALGNALYDFVTGSFGFAPKTCLFGMSRGGLWAYNWAVANPEKVALIFGDNPVCDFKSWPGGLGKGPGGVEAWKKCLAIYGLTESEARTWPNNPVDRLEVLAKAKIPILHVIGDADEVVLVEENSDLVRDRYRALGGHFEEIVKPGGKHHPHGLPDDPAPIVEFFERYAG